MGHERQQDNKWRNRFGQEGLYDPAFEHDNCGIGAIADIRGRKSHAVVSDALKIVENLEHRAGKDAEGKTGDGVGILTQIPHRFFAHVLKKEGVIKFSDIKSMIFFICFSKSKL